MKRYVSIKENRDFRRLYHRGKSYVDPAFVMYVAKGRGNINRIGITAGKKIGGAVERNRAKRLIRAAFSSLSAKIAVGYDFIFVARVRILDQKSYTLAESMQKQLKAAGVWCGISSDEQDAD